MKISLNRIVRYLIYSDLVFYTGWGLISPIFAVFILHSIKGGNAFVVGMAAAIHLIIRSLLRVPFGIAADSDKKLRIAYFFMLIGLLIASLIPFLYAISKLPIHIYILQAILGISLAMSTAGWTCIFTRNMDRGKESTEWGIDAVAVGLGPGIAAAVGGILVTLFSFTSVFIAVGIIGLIGVLLLLFVKRDILKKGYGKGSLFSHYEVRRLKKRFHH